MLPPAGAAGGATSGSGPAPGRSPRGRSSGMGRGLRVGAALTPQCAGAGGDGVELAAQGRAKSPRPQRSLATSSTVGSPCH